MKKIQLGLNTIWDRARWMCELGVSEFDAKNNSPGSHKKIIVKCPECKQKKSVRIGHIYEHKSIMCKCKSRGVTYPERFFGELLDQFNICHKTQLSKKDFKWCNNYRYDFYFEHNNETYIIETHGNQHYENGFRKKAQEVQRNDKLKFELAKNNGIDNYIVIDCKKSTFKYMKNSILNSKLSGLFDLSKVDWLKCEESALSNKVKEVCEYWNNKEEWEFTGDVAKRFKMAKVTVIDYLKRGTELGWTHYNSDEERIKSGQKGNKFKGKKVEMFKNGLSLGVFESATKLSKKSEELFSIKLIQTSISQVARGERNHHKGFTFKYVEENKVN